MTKARSLANVGSVAAQGLNFRNRIINGDMRIDQRNAGASVTPSNQFTVDRWCAIMTQASKFTVQQNAGSVTPPSGFTSYLGITSLSSYSVATGDTFFIYQGIEGNNIADLSWGSASAKAINISFWVRSSLTGTFSGALTNNAADRSYAFNYTINAANTWEYKTLTIAGDTTGTWLTNNGTGMNVRFGLGSGATFSKAAGAWGAGNIVQATDNTSVVGTSGATFYITGVQLEVGSGATPFESRPYGTELALCQRYYETSNSYPSIGLKGVSLNCYNSTAAYGNFKFIVPKRSQPSVSSLSSTNWGAYSNGGALSITAVTPQNIDVNCFQIWVQGSGFPAGYAAHLDGQTVNMFTISAEL